MLTKVFALNLYIWEQYYFISISKCMGCSKRCGGSIPASPPLHYSIIQYLLGVKLSISAIAYFITLLKGQSLVIFLETIHIYFLSSRCIPEAHLGS